MCKTTQRRGWITSFLHQEDSKQLLWGLKEQHLEDWLKALSQLLWKFRLNRLIACTYRTTATQDDWQRQCAIVMSGKIRYDTLVLELFWVVISQLYAQLILKTNLSQQSYSYLSPKQVWNENVFNIHFNVFKIHYQ